MWCYVVLCGIMGCYVVVVAVLRGRVACRGACGDGGGCACVVVLHLMLLGVSFLRVLFVLKFGV